MLQKTAYLTLVKSRLALGSSGCSFVCLFVCHHAENGPIHRKMVVDCPLVITSKVKLFFRPDKTRKKEWMAQPVFCIVDAGSCYDTDWLVYAFESHFNILDRHLFGLADQDKFKHCRRHSGSRHCVDLLTFNHPMHWIIKRQFISMN